MSVTLTINLRGRPLRRTYISHFDFWRFPQTLFFLTDENGVVTVNNTGVTWGDPAGPNGRITIRVHAQNSVVRVLDGALRTPIEVTQDFRVEDGDTININSNDEQQDHFRIMNLCLVVYETVFRQFRPFNRSNRGAFPFGRAATIEATRNRLPRIEVVYPDNSPAVLAFVEPASLATGFPLIHIKHKSLDRRLFGVPDPVPDRSDPIPPGTETTDPTLIPHELAHAFHFALMSSSLRASVETQYITWLSSRIAAGLPPFHNTTLATSQFIAWIEAFGVFSERFFFFSRRRVPSITGVALRQAFFRDELSASPLLDTTNLSGYTQVGRLDRTGVIIPALMGDDVEGAIYGAIFLDFARRVGLQGVGSRYLASGTGNVLQFDDFRNWIIRETNSDNDIIRVANTWGM
jgi:hypothetical protein